MKMSLDWKTGILPAFRTAGALMVGNAGVTYLLGSAKGDVAVTMFLSGATMILVGSIYRKQ
jgi:hypothetical protein